MNIKKIRNTTAYIVAGLIVSPLVIIILPYALMKEIQKRTKSQ